MTTELIIMICVDAVLLVGLVTLLLFKMKREKAKKKQETQQENKQEN